MRREQKTFLDTPADTLLEFLKNQGQGVFRAKQIYDWFFNRGAGTFEEMSDLPAGLRTALSKNAFSPSSASAAPQRRI